MIEVGSRIKFETKNHRGEPLHRGTGIVSGLDRVMKGTRKNRFDSAYVNVEEWDGDAPKRFFGSEGDQTWIVRFTEIKEVL